MHIKRTHNVRFQSIQRRRGESSKYFIRHHPKLTIHRNGHRLRAGGSSARNGRSLQTSARICDGPPPRTVVQGLTVLADHPGTRGKHPQLQPRQHRGLREFLLHGRPNRRGRDGRGGARPSLRIGGEILHQPA